MNDGLNMLAVARDREAISEISYQFCEFLDRMEPGVPREVLLAACLVSERMGDGDVCVELAGEAGRRLFAGDDEPGIRAPGLDEWIEQCESSNCVGRPGENTPLILDGNRRLYLHKYWNYERELADRLLARASRAGEVPEPGRVREAVDALFPAAGEDTDWQKVAAFTALAKNLTVISGGPGTGKTTTVAKILLLLVETAGYGHIALSAPTGKAAARLKEPVMQSIEEIQPEPAVLEKIPDEAFTLHKLLGARRHSSRFRYGKENPLPYDVVVVDEVSMVDLALMHRLVEALPKQAKLILLGDKDQLASVEAGAVLGSICGRETNRFSRDYIAKAAASGVDIPETASETDPKPLTDHIVLLEKSYRFGRESGIGNLAAAILSGKSGEALELLEGDSYPDAVLRPFSNSDELKEILIEFMAGYFKSLRDAPCAGDALELISQSGLLCVHRKGPLGSLQINRLTEHLLRAGGLVPATEEWYPGKPVMATRNDYSLGLRNGDLGITLPDGEGRLRVFFQKDEREYLSFYPYRLSYIETAYAMTVHKSQGSEFENVAVVLPGQVSRISTRELLYTAVTRARKRVSIVGSPGVFEQSLQQRAVRSSGLRDHLWDG